jgi:hypothetical protein
LKERYKEDDLQKIWSGNALRLMQTVQDARKQPSPAPVSGGGE